MKRLSVNFIVKAVLTVILVALLAISSIVFSSEALENVYTTENPELKFEQIYSAKSGEGTSSEAWKSSGTFTQSNGTYNLTSNSWSFWSNYDAVDFAYTEANFNTGAGSILTVSINLNSFTARAPYSSTGIMIRESLAANSRGVFLFVRGTDVYLMYRQGVSGGGQLPYTHFATTIKYPLELKMVVNKDRKKVYGYITAKGGKETPIGPISFDAAKKLYVGIAAHTTAKDTFDECVFSNLKISLDAPEGWEYEEDDTSSAPEEEEKEPEIVLPEDLPVTENTLLKETFTKGFLTEETDTLTNSVTTPLWTVRSGKPVMALDDEQTNRFLRVSSLDDPLMITAGDMNWTDYKTSIEFSYSSELTSLAETNELWMMLRHRSIVIGGSGEYSVRLVNKFSANGDTMYGQYMQLVYRALRGTFLPANGSYTVLREIQLADGAMLPFDTKHTLTAEVFDDTIKVYLNGKLMINFPETEEESKSRVDNRNMHLFGNIGLYVTNTSVDIDNITVTKLTDVLGGDYDNKIAGKFDDPIPDYIANGFMDE